MKHLALALLLGGCVTTSDPGRGNSGAHPAGWRIRKVDEIDVANRKRWVDGVLE